MGDPLTQLELPAKLSSLPTFMDFLRQGASAAGLDEKDGVQLELITEEILVNVIRHAYPLGTLGTVELGYVIEGPNSLRVQVTDTGRAFDPVTKETPDLTQSLAERPVGGLGIFLVKQFAQNVSYQRIDRRNILSFRFAKSV